MLLPLNRIVPESGVSRPARIRSIVVLPHPDGPRMKNSSPGLTEKEILSSAVTCPNFLDTSFTVMDEGVLIYF